MIIIPLGDDVEKKYFPTVTVFLIAACAIVFAYEARLVRESTNVQTIMEFVSDWGLVPQEFANGKMIGSITYMFLHADFIHLLGNMLVLWAFARTLEDTLGSALFCALYVLSGIAGGLSHAVFNAGADVPLVGASGAIAGVIGAYCLGFGAMTNIRTFVWFFRARRISVPTCVYAVVWLLLQTQGAFTSEEGGAGIAWMAHLGGFVAGSIMMVAFQRLSGRRLLHGRDGALEIAEVALIQSVQGRDTGASALGSTQLVCTYCDAALTDDHRIAENLWRCPNPGCEQLHIDSDPSATPAVQAV